MDQLLAKALISLRVCAGWSEPLLVAHITLLDNSMPWLICNVTQSRGLGVLLPIFDTVRMCGAYSPPFQRCQVYDKPIFFSKIKVYD